MTVPSISAAELFVPVPSGLGTNGALPAVPATGSWLSVELAIATQIQLPTTSWQPGGVEREMLAINAAVLAQEDALISTFAQSAFLSTAATGTVTYVNLQNQTVTAPVTPDPSNASQNPTGALGWLDNTGQNVYNVFRVLATYAAGPLALVNTGTVTQGPYLPGTYHASNATSGATYSNLATFSVPPSGIAGTGGVVTGVSTGLTSTTISTQSPHGVTPNSTIYVNVPLSSGVSGLAGAFAIVSAVPTSSTLVLSIASSGAWTAGGNIYICSVASMQADVIGVSSNAGLGTVTNAITQAPGVSVSNVVSWSATNYESNVAYAARCQLALAAASPNGPSQAYDYFALTAQQILATATPPYTFTNGAIIAANTYGSPTTGTVSVVIASATPASTTLGAAVTPGCAQNPVTNAVVGSGIVTVSTQNAHNLGAGGGTTTIAGVLGLPAVNGTWLASYVGSNSFSIPLSTSGTYTGGGSVEGGDLGAVDGLIQSRVVPDGVTALTVSALALPIAVVATVTVPQAFVALYQAAAPASLQAYLASLPLGGVVNSATTVPVSFEEIVAALISAGVLTLGSATYVVGSPSVTVNGGTSDVAFTSNQYQALLSSLSITVVGI